MEFISTKATWSLRTRIILFTCIVTFVASLLISGLGYFRTTDVALQTAIEGLAGETRLMSLRFKSKYLEMENDVFVVSQTPPINGIMRSTSHDDVDPFDGSSTALWRARLATIFSSVMANRPYYTQMRYIGVADGGREIVRVNRVDEGVEVVTREALQKKGEEAYFKQAFDLRDGEVFFSDVSYNREKGQIDTRKVPTVRTVLPVFDSGGALFGMIVINADYSALLRRAFEEIAPDKNTLIVNHAGDYMEYRMDGTVAPFEFHDDYISPPPEFVSIIQGAVNDEQSFVEEEAVSYFVRLNVADNNPDAFLGVVLRVPREELMQEVYQARRESVVLALGLVLFTFILTLIVSRKITDPIRKMAEEREMLVEQLISSNADLERFAYIASHDLQEPLRMVKNYSEMLQKEVGDKLNEKEQKMFHFVINGAQHMQALVADILAYSRIGSESDKYEHYDANKIMSGVLANFEDEIASKKAVVTYDELPFLFGNSMRFSRLLQNLVGNALKYQAPDVPPRVHVSAEISPKDTHVWQFSVADNGIGMKPEYCQQIFEPFKRLHNRFDYPGSGIGLSICKRVVESMGGTIWVDSEEGKGSTFYFTIPKYRK